MQLCDDTRGLFSKKKTQSCRTNCKAAEVKYFCRQQRSMELSVKKKKDRAVGTTMQNMWSCR